MVNTFGFGTTKKPLRKLQKFKLESAIFIGKFGLLCIILVVAAI